MLMSPKLLMPPKLLLSLESSVCVGGGGFGMREGQRFEKVRIMCIEMREKIIIIIIIIMVI